MIEARKPTRPKLTPITGTPVPRRRRERAEDRPVAADRDRQLRALRLVDDLDARARGDRPHLLDRAS